ncbi:MAG TPA: aspartate racemase, partial [Thermosynergistes sp.]|nr:aspartate racemase [Thermosynergistes sp.]
MSKGDKVLGVLGGMGPAATAEFLRLLTILAPAAKDQDHPVV